MQVLATPLSPGTQSAESCSGSVTQEPDSGVSESIPHPPCEHYHQHIDWIQLQGTSNKKYSAKITYLLYTISEHVTV